MTRTFTFTIMAAALIHVASLQGQQKLVQPGDLEYRGAFRLPDGPAEIGWSGDFRGRPAVTGVYTWFLEVEYIDGFVEMMKGNVSLVR